MSDTPSSSARRLALALTDVLDAHRSAGNGSIEGAFNLTYRLNDFDAALTAHVIDIVKAEQVRERIEDDELAASLEDDMHATDQYG